MPRHHSPSRGRFRPPKRHHSAIAAAAAAVATAAALLTAGGGHPPKIQIVFGQHLTPKGQTVYNAVAAKHVEQGQKLEHETLPPAKAALVAKLNQQTAENGTVGPNHPVTLATPEPITQTRLVQNYSTRHGARPALWVVHDTESPNAPGLQDVLAITAWFNNPASQASSNYTTDADGNTILMVPETAKAWTQAYFNPWAISDELIGYATQKTWPDAQLRAAAQLAAAGTARWGIPVQRGRVNGCTIIRAGILEHNDLGQCGGSHHDAGPAFPLDRFIQLVREYRAGGYHPKLAQKPARKPSPAAKPRASRPACTTRNVQQRLAARGAHLLADGVIGPKTGAAIAGFQRRHHLRATGRPNAPTCKALALRG